VLPETGKQHPVYFAKRHPQVRTAATEKRRPPQTELVMRSILDRVAAQKNYLLKLRK
jgi:hypothetical protein